MHRRIEREQVGTGSTAVIMLDRYVAGYSIVVDITSGTVTDWDIEFTGSDLQRGDTAVWQDHSSLVGISGSSAGNFQFPPVAARLTINTGTGTARAVFIPNSSVA